MIRQTIIKTRKEQGQTQGGLALKVGVRRATISDFETGKTGISSMTIDRIFEVLNIKLVTL